MTLVSQGGYVDDTVFFDTILPTQGLRCVAIPAGSGWSHYWGPDNAWLVKRAAELDAKGKSVYFGCATYKLKNSREQANVAMVRAFWVDLDVGVTEPGKRPKYATKKAAAQAILMFAAKLKLPRPFINDSGHGIHAFFAIEADTPPEVWKPLAEALKRALRAFGVLFDPARTADEASVLRPPGTHNRKTTPMPVKRMVDGVVAALPIYAAILAPWSQAPTPSPAGKAKLSDKNAALGGGLGYDPSSAHLMADRCAIIGMMRDTLGKLDQPTWYHSLGVLLHTEEAPAICHEWSKGDERYTAAETNAALIRLGEINATTCDKLGEQHPDVCAACPFQGKIKSPIVLGRAQKMDPGAAAAQAQTDTGGGSAGGGKGGAFGGGAAAAGPATPSSGSPDWPPGYSFRLEGGHKVLTYYVAPKKEGEEGFWDIFCSTFFRPAFNYEVDGVHFNDWIADNLDGSTRTFTLEGSTIGKGGKDVAAKLGEVGIMINPGRGRAMDGYLNNWMTRLTKTTPMVKAYRSFGWNGDVFVTGDVVIKPDGTLTTSVLHGMAKQKRATVACKGSLDTWVQLVDRAYNAPGQEAYQFQLACAFAAPLLSLMQQVQGVTVYAHSAGSGVGKTTVQRVALSAWGDWSDMMLAQNKATANALWGLLGAYNTLPVVYDELTNAPNPEVSELVFSVSSGRAKERMTSSGDIRENNSNWSTIMLASGNSLLSDKLAAHRANAEAEISRLFEFTVDFTNHLSVVEANDLFPQFADHYGHAGLAFAEYITTHRPAVTKALQDMQKRIGKAFALTQVERHWSALFASVLVAVALCRSLKLVAFEVEPLKVWMGERLAENRVQKVASVLTDEDKLVQMIGDLWPDVLVTIGRGTRHRGGGTPAQLVMDKPAPSREAIKGRSILGAPGDPDQLWISRPAIREWVARKGANYNDLYGTATRLGWVEGDDHRFDLGVGTLGFSTNTYVKCWKFFPDRMAGAPGVAVSNVVSLNAGLTGKP